MSVSFKETYLTRVLVVDRDPLAASLHRAYVDATDGFVTCGTATTSRQALTLAKLRHPDIVLLDLSLDDATVLLHRLLPLPVLGITSVHRPQEALALRPSLRSLLFKPFLVKTLGERLERCVPVRR